jgi:uncharacterized membrane protein
MYALHPFIVHFPIALLTLALGFELAARLSGKPSLSEPGWWFQLLGTLGVILAALSGVVAEADAGKALLVAPEVFERHEQLAFFSAVLFAVLLFFRFSSHRSLPMGWPRLYLVALTVGVALLLTAGWFGGELVFKYGIGTMSARP